MRKKRREAQLRRYFDEPFVEDYPEPFVGYKLMHTYGDVIQLRSNVKHSIWMSQFKTAQCLDGWGNFTHADDMTPHPECSCGIYAYRQIVDTAVSDILNIAIRATNESPKTFFLVTVELGGHVIIADNVYKASHAKIVDIHIANSSAGNLKSWSRLPRVRQYYGLSPTTRS